MLSSDIASFSRTLGHICVHNRVPVPATKPAQTPRWSKPSLVLASQSLSAGCNTHFGHSKPGMALTCICLGRSRHIADGKGSTPILCEEPRKESSVGVFSSDPAEASCGVATLLNSLLKTRRDHGLTGTPHRNPCLEHHGQCLASALWSLVLP